MHIHRRFPNPTSVTWHLGSCDERCPDDDDIDHICQRQPRSPPPHTPTPPPAYEGEVARATLGAANGQNETEIDSSNDGQTDQTPPVPNEGIAHVSDKQRGSLPRSTTDENDDMHEPPHRGSDVGAGATSSRVHKTPAPEGGSCDYSEGSISSGSDGVSIRGRRRYCMEPRLPAQDRPARSRSQRRHRYYSPSPIRYYPRTYWQPLPSIYHWP